MIHINDRRERSCLIFLRSKVSVPENCIASPTARTAEQAKGFYAHYIAVQKPSTFVARKQHNSYIRNNAIIQTQAISSTEQLD